MSRQGAPHFSPGPPPTLRNPPPIPRRQGKAIFRWVWGMLWLIFILSLVSMLPVKWFFDVYTRSTGRPVTTLGFIGVTFLWFSMIYVLIRWLIYLKHKRTGGFSHGKMLDSAISALDQIAGGDFDIILEPDQYNHYKELIDQINLMAKNLSSMEHMRQDFVSNVSHEIGSPLTSIQGFARLLKQPDLDEEQRLHYLEVIEAESRRLSKLSENLLKLSLLDSEPIAPGEFRLDKQLEHVVLMLEPQWLEKELDVQAGLEPVTLEGDADLLEQVWINLLQNAVKFTPAGGTIRVELRQGEEVIQVEVEDSGAGIAEESLPHIFERFYKADKARDRKIGGSGLGLSLAKKITELHGGKIDVQSVVGKGTLFTVRLPLRQEGTGE